MRSLGGIAAARLSAGGGADQASLAADAHARQPRLLAASAAPPRAWEERRALDGGVPAQKAVRRGAPACGIPIGSSLRAPNYVWGALWRTTWTPSVRGWHSSTGYAARSCAVAAAGWRSRTPDACRLRSRARCPTARRRCRRRRSASGAARCSTRCALGCWDASACALTRFALRVASQRCGGGARLHARLGAETRSARATCVPATPRVTAAALRVDCRSCACGTALGGRLRARKCLRLVVSAAARARMPRRSQRPILP